eukprot:m.210535 g.210535  ORF g.210535 m.210535 type:complete len:126 (-) comp10736_c1_seq8:536-913(-)
MPGAMVLTGLETLYIRHNPLRYVHVEALDLTSVHTIDLSFNKLANISAFTFTKCSNLETLNLASNSLSILFTQSLSSLPNLKKLQLEQNLITSIELGAFFDASSLATLYVVGRVRDLNSHGLAEF